MKRIAITITITLLMGVAFTGFAQPDWWVEDYHPTDTTDHEDFKGGYSYYGMVHTPRGLLRALVIYVQFTKPGEEPSEIYSPNNFWDNNWPINSLPSNQEDFFYTLESHFSPGDETKNISNFFYQHSNPSYPFMMVGEAFPHLITIPVYPDDSTFSTSTQQIWNEFSRRAFQEIQDNYSDFDWSRFDRRKNRVSSSQYYQEDNSVEDPDNYLDYVIIRFRFWDHALRPVEDYKWLTRRTGFNGFAGIKDFTFTNSQDESFSIPFLFGGFTMVKGNAVESLFIHEFAHNLFNSGHHVGANKHFGSHFYMTSGYSFIHRTVLHSINAWDRWWLDWSEITHDLSDVSQNGEYLIGDFVTTGESMRIKLPTPDDQYLWIENRTGSTVWDDRRNPGGSHGGNPFPPAPTGVMMFLEDISGDRTELGGVGHANKIKFIYPQGNFDYTRSQNFTSHYMGRNRLYHFNHIQPNPFGGHNDLSEIRDDYYSVFLDSDNNDLGCSTPNGIINYTGGDGFRFNESFPVFNRNNSFIFGFLGSNMGFSEGKKISISTNPALIAHLEYDANYKKLAPIYLHGLSVEVVEYQGSGVNRKAKVRVRYDDYVIDNDVRWTGDIILPADVPLSLLNTYWLEEPDPERVATIPWVKLTLDRSGTPNRHTLGDNNDFVNPTVLTMERNASFYMGEATIFEVAQGSMLKLENKSHFTISDNSELRIKSGSVLKVDNCGQLEVLKGGQVVVEEGGILKISANALLNFHNGHGSIELQPGAVIAEGYLHPHDLVPESYRIKSGTNTWEGAKYNMLQDLIVEPNAELSIQNSELKFSGNKRMVVMRMASVAIENSLITHLSTCEGNGLWQGIEVEGRPTFPQIISPSGYQGFLSVENSIIEKAETGIDVGAKYNKGGGVIHVDNSDFINNVTAISFGKYRYSNEQNISFINNTRFITTNYLNRIGKTPFAFIQLDNVARVRFTDNYFENIHPQIFPITKRGYGIFSRDSDLVINGRGSSQVYNNLFTAINIIGGPKTTGLWIENQIMSSCFNGVYIRGVISPVLKNNYVKLTDETLTDGIPTAISISPTSNFEVDNNTLIGKENGYGIYLRAHGNTSGLITRNSLETFKIGINARGSYEFTNNVQVQCNNFSNNTFADINVLNNGIAHLQGTSQVSASNVFNGNPVWNIYASQTSSLIVLPQIVYYAYPEPFFYPKRCTKTVLVVNATSLSDCLFTLWQSKTDINNILLHNDSIAEAEMYLQSIHDMGETDDLISILNSEQNPIALRNSLLNLSPYLSDSVMTKATRDDVNLPNLMLTQILMANPQAAKSVDVFAAIDKRTNTIPDYLIDAIRESGSEISPIDLINSEIYKQITTREVLTGKLLASYISDSLGKKYDSLAIIKNFNQNIIYRYLPAFISFEQNNLTEAVAHLQAIFQEGEATLEELKEIDDLKKMFSIYKATCEQGFPESKLDSITRSALLRIISEGNGLPSVFAENIIAMADTIPFIAPDFTFDNTQSSTSQASYGVFLAIEPYPVNNYVIASYNLNSNEYKDAMLAITSINGQTMHSELLTRPEFEILVEVEGWSAGLYLVKIVDKGIVLAQSSFVIDGSENPSFSDSHVYEHKILPVFGIHPNPTDGLFKIVAYGCSGKCEFSYEIVSQSGAVLLSGRGFTSKDILLSHLSKGKYTVVVTYDGERKTFSIVLN